MFCSGCKAEVRVQEDRSSGDTVCVECGLVLEDYYINPGDEQRHFNDDSEDNRRHGPPQDPFQQNNLGTTIQDNNKMLPKRCISTPEAALHKGLNAVQEFGDRMCLTQNTIDLAKDNYIKYREGDAKVTQLDQVVAACIFHACKSDHCARTPTEIKKFVGSRCTKLSHYIFQVGKVVPKSEPVKVVTAQEYMNRFCNQLNIDNHARRAAIEIGKRCEALLNRRASTISAVSLYTVSLVLCQKGIKGPSIEQIKEASGVHDGTIMDGFRCIRDQLHRFVPDWFCTPEQLAKIR